MSYSFDISLGNESDHIRVALGDTNGEPNAILADETITAKVATFGYVEALAQCAEAVRSWLSQNPDAYDEGSGGLKQVWKARDQNLKDLIKSARSGQIAPPELSDIRPGASVGPIGASIGGIGIYDCNRAMETMRTD